MQVQEQPSVEKPSLYDRLGGVYNIATVVDARPEAMAWCEANGVDYIFGLAGNDVLHAQIRILADDLCVRRAEGEQDKRRTWTEFRYAAKSWTTPRRVVARLEATCAYRKG